MLTHGDIWAAIDRCAQSHGLTPSGLARRAGLDPTTFNRSKRVTRDGKPRWPSTESISKILTATTTPVTTFLAFLGRREEPAEQRNVPLIALSQCRQARGFDSAGLPVGLHWDEIAFPSIGDPRAFAIEIEGDSLEPLYREGDVIIVSPEASMRRGDRVLVRTIAADVVPMQLLRKSARAIQLRPLIGEALPRTLAAEDIAWMARILWASQ